MQPTTDGGLTPPECEVESKTTQQRHKEDQDQEHKQEQGRKKNDGEHKKKQTELKNTKDAREAEQRC